MTALSFDYAFYHVERVIRMIRGDSSALAEMDISADGFWRSFTAIIFALPAFLFTWVTEARELATTAPYSMTTIIFIQAVLEMIIWIFPVVLLAWVLKLLGLSSRFSHLIIVRNWMGLLFAYVFVFLDLPSFFIPNFEIPALVIMLAFFVAIYVTIRLTRMALECDASVAIGLIIGELLVTALPLIYFYQAIGLYGVPA